MNKFLAALLAAGVMVGTLRAQTAPAKAKPAQKAPVPSSRSLLNPASLRAKAPETFKVKFTTTKGAFVVQVTRAWAPLGADRFYNLVRNHFYNGATFFRVLPGFVAQFGINANPQVSIVWRGASIKDDSAKESNRRGTLTFATSGPNTRTTQLFINFGNNSQLDRMGFTPFGEVVEGMDVVDQLYSGYGEGAPQGQGPEQARIEAEGKAYLVKEFPKLDSIVTAEIISPPPAAHPAARPATHRPAEPAKKKPA